MLEMKNVCGRELAISRKGEQVGRMITRHLAREGEEEEKEDG